MKSKIEDNVCVITLDNTQIDALTVKNFLEEIQGKMADHKQILIVFSNVKFVDSSGLGSILTLHREHSQRNTKIVLCGMNNAVETLFDMVKLSQIIPCYKTVQEGMDYFSREL